MPNPNDETPIEGIRFEVPDHFPAEWTNVGNIAIGGSIDSSPAPVELSAEVISERNRFVSDMTHRVEWAMENQSLLPEEVDVQPRLEGQMLLKIIHPEARKNLSAGDFGILIDDGKDYPDRIPGSERPRMSVTRTFTDNDGVFNAQRVDIMQSGSMLLKTSKDNGGDLKLVPDAIPIELTTSDVLAMMTEHLDASSAEVGLKIPPAQP